MKLIRQCSLQGRAFRVLIRAVHHFTGWLNNLGEFLQSRFERTGEMANLEEAIETAREAVQSTPHDHPDRAARLNNLGTKLGRRFERTGEMANLEEAIEMARERGAVHPTRPP